MKTLFIFSLLFFTFITHAQTYVPDDNFEQALIDLGYDDVLDDYVVTDNINSITSLEINERDISSIEGIEDFIALEYLDCENNIITEFDLSHNLSLQYLFCSLNNLTEINLDNNLNLKVLYCAVNPLIFLDLSSNVFLEELFCITSIINSIDIRNGNNSLITGFSAYNNPNLTCIYVDDSSDSSLLYWIVDDNTYFVETEAECDAIGVEELSEKEMLIYPNPTRNSFALQGVEDIVSVDLLSITGEVLIEKLPKESVGYCINNVNSGVYLLRILTLNNYYFTKLVVK